MFTPKTFSHLCAAMQTGAKVTISRKTGVVNSIAREDGNGFNFLVKIQPLTVNGSNGGEPEIVFFRAES